MRNFPKEMNEGKGSEQMEKVPPILAKFTIKVK
jgi:hypothetical protein